MSGEDRIVQEFDMERINRIIKIPLICIYNHPSDYPEKIVARLWDINRPTSLVMITDTLEEMRERIPAGMVVLHRQEKDDPIIIETWF